MAVEPPGLLLADGTQIVCRRVLRQLPGKREVFAGERQGVPVVAKLYLDPRRADVHARREVSGLAALAAAGLPGPELVYHGRDNQGRPVIVVGEITGAESLATRWEAADRTQRAALLRDMMKLLAAHHTAGISQNDLHLGNFLLTGDMIHSIDGDAVDARPQPLGRRRSVRNLALFCAQFLPDVDELSLVASAHYAEARGWSAPGLRARLPEAVASARLRRWHKFRGKLFRDCSAIARRQTAAGNCLVVRGHLDTLAGLLEDPDAGCPVDPKRRLKNGATATVWRTENGGLPVVVKRYNVKNRVHGARRLVKASRASVSWRNAHMLDFFGVATPKPLALIVPERRMTNRPAYFLAEWIAGEKLRPWIRAHLDRPEAIHWVGGEVAGVLRRMHATRISHGDLKASNFIVADERLFLIDLDAMRSHRTESGFRRAWEQDLRRFMANWQRFPEVAVIMAAALADVPGADRAGIKPPR